MEPFDLQAVARISAAFVKAIAEAKAKIEAQQYDGDDLRDLVRHAHELRELLREQLAAADPAAAGELRAVFDAMGEHLRRLEALVAETPASPTRH